MLLPSLTHLEVVGASWSRMSGGCISALARALRHNATLRTLILHDVHDLYVRAYGDDAEEEEEEGHEDHGRLPLRTALPTTQLQRLDVMTGHNGISSVSALQASGALPASLQELRIFDHSDDDKWAEQLPLLLAVLHNLPLLHSLELDRDEYCELGAEGALTCARLLLHPAAAPPQLRRLSVRAADRLPEECAAMAAELRGNTALTALRLADVSPTTLRAFGDTLAHNAGLRTLSLKVHVEEDEAVPLADALSAVCAGLRNNASLHTLKLTFWLLLPTAHVLVEDAMDELEEAAARHPTCTLHLNCTWL